MLLSILIRNYNEAPDLEKTLLLLQKQKLPTPYEIVVSDNESTDNSVAIAKTFGCRVVINKRGKFSYGQLLNFGISHCQGEFVFLLSAHIAIIGEQSVANGLAPLISNSQLAYVCGMPANQVSMMLYGLQPKIFTKEDFITEQDWQQAQFYLLGAPCGIIRKSVWESIKFDETLEFSEDRYWSRCVIESGYKGLFGVDFFFYYFKQKTSKANRQRLYAESLAHYRIYGQPETRQRFYYRSVATATADIYHAIARFPKVLFLLLKIRLIRSRSRNTVSNSQLHKLPGKV
jgi:glycosyltransferase involved in cell wall biosynthesis